MAHRKSVTLIEVLVAIFIMGIGMLALLSLFPLGIMRMSGAIEAEKSAQACRMANALATLRIGSPYNVRNDPAYVNLFSNPPPWEGATCLPPDPNGQSYPIFVDPMGYSMFGQPWLSPLPNTIPRRTTSFVQNLKSANHWFTIQDDVVWGLDGTPKMIVGPDLLTSPPTPGRFNRDTRYSWAYMLQRPRTADPSFVNLTVCVFNSRALTGSLNEYLYQSTLNEVTFDPVANTITLVVNPSVNTLHPAVPGNWLLDASYVPSATGPYATVNANFYRIVAVKQNGANSVTYEVQPPLRNFPATNSSNALQKVIFMEGLAEVFEKGAGPLP